MHGRLGMGPCSCPGNQRGDGLGGRRTRPRPPGCRGWCPRRLPLNPSPGLRQLLSYGRDILSRLVQLSVHAINLGIGQLAAPLGIRHVLLHGLGDPRDDRRRYLGHEHADHVQHGLGAHGTELSPPASRVPVCGDGSGVSIRVLLFREKTDEAVSVGGVRRAAS